MRTEHDTPATDHPNSADILTLENVTSGYQGSVVLRDVSLRVPTGRAVALLGPNGAGKTTLMRTASGVIRSMSGRVTLGGNDISALRVHERARGGMCDIPEGRGIFPSLTVRENLVLQFRSGRAEESINTAVDAFPSLGRHLNQMAGSLSGGEQQMLALTRAHASQAKVVMVDEVSLGLAPVVVDRLFEFLSAMVTGGTALLIVEQYVSRALELASHAYLLNRGAIVFDGPSSQLSAGDIFQHYLSIDVAPRAGRKVGTQGKKDAPSD